ncbi:hypothetical protein ACP70R_044209 [Stipagrostis hirtigluma subsp. patula]
MDVDGGRGGFIPSPATEDETVARRRSRRVSFAETTAVHVFARDEDFETPPEERAASASPSPSPGKSSAEAEDGDDTEGEGEETPLLPVRFPQEMGSSSPGSAAGSIVSNDDDNFFGPVSTSFIQSGRPSDSGISEDDNHDITLDSRTFSLHFRNVAPSDDCTANSAASLMTPNPASTESAMELIVSEPGVKSSGGRGTFTDMSLFTDDHESHDYAKRPPTLNNLVQKIKAVQQTMSPKAGVGDVTPNRFLNLAASDKENREENLCIGNDISSDELGTVNTLQEHISMQNPVSGGTDPVQEDNAMIIVGHVQSQENCDHGHVVVDPGVNKTLEPPAGLSPLYKSFTNNVDLQSHLTLQSLSTDQPSGTNDTTGASSMGSVDLENHLLGQPPGTNNTKNASQLFSAAPAVSSKDVEHLQHQNKDMDTLTVLHTPKTVAQPLQVPQGSISSLRFKRQKLFSPNALSSGKMGSQDACSLGNDFGRHEKRISSLEEVLKSRLQESPAVSQLPLDERNGSGLLANDTLSNAEDQDSTVSVFSNSVPRQQLKKTSESYVQGTPSRQGLSEATKIQDIPSDVHTLDSVPARECNSLLDSDGVGRKRCAKENSHAEQEQPEKTDKVVLSPGKSRKQLSFESQTCMVEERKNEAHDFGQPANVDWNKMVSSISKATDQVFSATIRKLNLQQLDMLGDKLGEIQVARKYKRLSAAVRIRDHCGDHQKRLAEARSLHDKLLYEKAKLQINNLKLEKLRDNSNLCQEGIQECCFLKSKILDAAQMKDASRQTETLINASDRQEGFAHLTEKRLELNLIQQKLENLRSSLECFCNREGDASSDTTVRSAEEQLEFRDQCHTIHHQAGLWVLNDMVKRDNKRDVILNYCNFLFQRITLNTSDLSCIFVNNSLNGSKIGQTFSNLSASMAFNFVFKAEEKHRVNDLRSLEKMTMETSLLLGNLLDVLDEIKFAKMELRNLTSATFVLESQSCQLALRLCFMSFKNGKRVAFTIDMTDLNRSVYPSEPSELSIKVCKAQTTLADPSIDKIVASSRNLQPGRTVILRLCRMVSQLIHELPG